ncbi:hypothetical protein Ddc_07368 [Ditylenchus destructor]|nr:hypothetical protein Ddc_07368 [Ditylenchus destructor]
MDINHPADSPLSSYHNLFPQIAARRESIDKIVPVSRRPSACSTVILVNDREQQVGDDFEENSPVARELSPSPTDEQKKKLFSRRNIVPKLTKAASTLSASFASPNSQQTSTWNSVTNLIKNKAGVGGSHKDSINSCRESELAVRTSKNQRSNSTITVVATVELGNHEPNENATITSGPRHNAVTALAAQMSNERRQQGKFLFMK